jgi:hypothetical protein
MNAISSSPFQPNYSGSNNNFGYGSVSTPSLSRTTQANYATDTFAMAPSQTPAGQDSQDQNNETFDVSTATHKAFEVLHPHL